MTDDTERLIVLIEARLDQFEKAMNRAEKRGTKTFQGLQTSADKATSAVQARVNQMAQTQGRAMDHVAGKTEAANERSRRSYEALWREELRVRESLNTLRASLDPAFAATMRYEQAVEQVNDALRAGIITETEHRQVLDQVSAAYVQSGRAAGAHTGMLGSLGTMSDATKSKLQNAGFQVQDVAVQMMAGTDAARALSMQLPQLLGGFGLLGVALGTLASIGLPLLSSWFGEAGGAAKDFGAAMGEVENSIAAMNEQAAIYTAEGLVALKAKYGEVNLELMRFIALQTEALQLDAIQAARDALATLKEDLSGGFFGTGDLKFELQEAFGLGLVEANKLYAAMRRIDEAKTFEEQRSALTAVREMIQNATGGLGNMTEAQRKFFLKVVESEDAMRQLAAVVPKQGWLAAAIGQAETLGGKLWEAVRAKMALAEEAAKPGMDTGNLDWAKNDIGFVKPGSELIYTPPEAKGGTGGGGVDGGGSSKIDALLADLQTEREVIAAWYEESLATLNGATEAELALVGGRHEALERLEAEHQERLRAIRDDSQGRGLQEMAGFFGEMANIASVGGKKTAKAVATFQAIEGTVNAYGAAIKALNTPGITLWGRYAAYASVLAAGLKGVSAIRSAGGIGGGGGGGGGAGAGGGGAGGAAGSDTSPLRVAIQPLDPSAAYSGAALRKLLDGLTEEAGNRGMILGWQA